MFKTRAAELRFRVITFTNVILCTVINRPQVITNLGRSRAYPVPT